MSLFRRSSYRGQPMLVPVRYGDAEKCLGIADPIPGATVDEDGSVMGPEHALAAVLDAAGDVRESNGINFTGYTASGKLELPKFQQHGVGRALNTMADGVLINDDVGLGKTVQTIATMS